MGRKLNEEALEFRAMGYPSMSGGGVPPHSTLSGTGSGEPKASCRHVQGAAEADRAMENWCPYWSGCFGSSQKEWEPMVGLMLHKGRKDSCLSTSTRLLLADAQEGDR